MTSLQPPLLRQPDEMAAAAWEPGFLYLKSVALGGEVRDGQEAACTGQKEGLRG